MIIKNTRNLFYLIAISILLFSCKSNEEKTQELVLEARSAMLYGQNEEALILLDRIQERNSKLPVIYFMRGNIFATQFRYQEAKEQFDIAIELDDTFLDAYVNRGRMWFYLGRPDKRCEDFLKAEQLGATNLGEDTKFCK